MMKNYILKNKTFSKIAILFLIVTALFVTNTTLVPNEMSAINILEAEDFEDSDDGIITTSFVSKGETEADMKGWVNGLYAKSLALGTVLACALITWCLIVRMVSKNQKSIESANGWIKMILITYLCFILVGVIIKLTKSWSSTKDTTLFNY